MSHEEMTLEEAYEILKIGPESTLAEITKSWHDLSKRHHPDSSKDDENVQSELNHARDLLTGKGTSRQLVPIAIKRELQRIEKDLIAQKASIQLADYVGVTKRRRTRSIQAIKYIAIILTTVAAGIGWLNTDDTSQAIDSMRRSLDLENQAQTIFGSIGAHLGAIGHQLAISLEPYKQTGRQCAVCLGIIAAFFQGFVVHQSYLVESLKDNLADDDYCSDHLWHLGLFQIEDQFTAKDLVELSTRVPFFKSSDRKSLSQRLREILLTPSRWLRLDPEQQVRVTILKSLEHGIIENTPESKRIYRVTREFKAAYNSRRSAIARRVAAHD